MKLHNLSVGISALLLSSVCFANCNDKILSDYKISAWAYEALLASNNYSFMSYKSVSKAKVYFTPSAWSIYQKEFLNDTILNNVIRNKLIVSVGVEDAPLLLKEASNHWQIQIPLLIHYRTANNQKTQKNIIIFDIIKEDSPINCLKIARIVKAK